MMNFDMDDELFGGTVMSKLVDILRNANKNLVELEIERVLTRLAATETLLEQKGVSEAEIRSFILQNQDSLKSEADSLGLTLTADIVTQNE
jgi:hypothetical protein